MKQTSICQLLFTTLILLSNSSFAVMLNDNGQISATHVTPVDHVKSEADILNAIKEANTKHLPIAIMGVQHSQGGQSIAENAIELDMLSFNKILEISEYSHQIRVQSGITWSDIQKAINKDGLAIQLI